MTGIPSFQKSYGSDRLSYKNYKFVRQINFLNHGQQTHYSSQY